MYGKTTEREKTKARRQTSHGGGDQDGFGTKECPVCHAICFDDMGTCYGCLHTFAAEQDDPARKEERSFGSGMHDMPMQQEEGICCDAEEDAFDAKTRRSLKGVSDREPEGDPSCSRTVLDRRELPETFTVSSAEKVLAFSQGSEGCFATRELFEIVISVRMPQQGTGIAVGDGVRE